MSEWVILSRKRRKKKRRVRPRAPVLTEKQILAWADAYHERTGRWPKASTSPRIIPNSLGETWTAVETALRNGQRGLPGGSSLARLLAKHRGVRNHWDLPTLTYEKILAWADAYHERTGRWPKAGTSPQVIPNSLGETWINVDAALRNGRRGLRGGSSLARLLAKHRGVRNPGDLPTLTYKKILAWADAYHERTGRWPNKCSSPRVIPNSWGETWLEVNDALRKGHRGLPGGSSLARLLVEHRNVRDIQNLPPLTEKKILAWADEYHRRTGRWPTRNDGPIPEVPGETWKAVQGALILGNRGLPGGSSLARLLAAHRNVRNIQDLPPLTEKKILAWADEYHHRTGRWPTIKSAWITKGLEEVWENINVALSQGHRGLPGGSSLARLLAKHRGVRNHMDLPPLTYEKILTWADAYHRRTGRWPTRHDGSIPEAPGETWMAVERALASGHRHLPGGSSLARLLAEHRGVRR